MTFEWLQWLRRPTAEQHTLPPPGQGAMMESYRRSIKALQQEKVALLHELDRANDLLKDKTRQLDRFDIEKIRQEAMIEILSHLIEPLEDVKRATANTPKYIQKDQWFTGMISAYRKLAVALAKPGLRTFGKVHEPFDPHIHSAVNVVERDESGEDTIDQVYMSGYSFQGFVIQPAQVCVAKLRTRQTA